MIKRKTRQTLEPIKWERADSEQLRGFDPATKECAMNCGPHRDDPRSDKERKFLCEDCTVVLRS